MVRPGDTQRFVLRRKPGAAASQSSLPEELENLEGVTIVEASPRMVLVDAPAKVVERVMRGFSDWMVIPETLTPLPDTKPKPRHS